MSIPFEIINTLVSLSGNERNFMDTNKFYRQYFGRKYIIMNKKQLMFMDAMKSHTNVILSGPAGSGKSYCIKRSMRRGVILLATTGCAAHLIGGRTVHSFIKNITNYDDISCIIIDESSMLNERLFIKLYNAVIKRLGHDRTQYVLCGDFLQLQPVEPFSILYSPIIKELEFKMIYLDEIHRQNDKEFVKLLDQIRFGKIDDFGHNMLMALVKPPAPNAIKLRFTNKEVDVINMKRLSEIEGNSYLYTTTTAMCGLMDKKVSLPISTELKIGAKVMLLINIDVRRGLVNGSIGEVIGFDGDYDMLEKTFVRGEEPCPAVQFRCGTYLVGYFKKEHKKRINGKKILVGTTVYLPLKLAWSVTVHKAQGSTLDEVDIDLSGTQNGLFYTAISRARNMEGLSLVRYDTSKIIANTDMIKQIASIIRNTARFQLSNPNIFRFPELKKFDEPLGEHRAKVIQLREAGLSIQDIEVLMRGLVKSSLVRKWIAISEQ